MKNISYTDNTEKIDLSNQKTRLRLKHLTSPSTDRKVLVEKCDSIHYKKSPIIEAGRPAWINPMPFEFMVPPINIRMGGDAISNKEHNAIVNGEIKYLKDLLDNYKANVQVFQMASDKIKEVTVKGKQWRKYLSDVPDVNYQGPADINYLRSVDGRELLIELTGDNWYRADLDNYRNPDNWTVSIMNEKTEKAAQEYIDYIESLEGLEGCNQLQKYDVDINSIKNVYCNSGISNNYYGELVVGHEPVRERYFVDEVSGEMKEHRWYTDIIEAKTEKIKKLVKGLRVPDRNWRAYEYDTFWQRARKAYDDAYMSKPRKLLTEKAKAQTVNRWRDPIMTEAGNVIGGRFVQAEAMWPVWREE